MADAVVEFDHSSVDEVASGSDAHAEIGAAFSPVGRVDDEVALCSTHVRASAPPRVHER